MWTKHNETRYTMENDLLGIMSLELVETMRTVSIHGQVFDVMRADSGQNLLSAANLKIRQLLQEMDERQSDAE